MMNTEIVKMSENHIPFLSQIEKECFSTPWSEDGLRAELTNSHARFFVALNCEHVLGYIGAHNILGEVYITNVAVRPIYRNQGVGKALVEELFNECEKENSDFITLEVRKSNTTAIKLYEKCGFSLVGERKNFYENPKEDALLMTRYFNNKD